MRIWRILLFAGVLIAAVVGIASGHLGSGLLWGGLAAFALIGELLQSRTGAASFGLLFIQAMVFSLVLLAGAASLIVAATLAPTEEERDPFIGLAVLVTPMAALVCWATVAPYRRVRRTSTDSRPHRSAAEVYAEMVSKAQAQPPDVQRPLRERRMRLFFGIATAGWALGILAQTLTAEWGAASAGVAAALGLILMLGGALAAGWTSAWVFGTEGPDQDRDKHAG